MRVTVIGDSVFACEIGPVASTALNSVDWRSGDIDALPHRIVDLPTGVEVAIRKMLELMGLRFGAIDLVRTPTDEYYFLEVNPNGQWYWIELHTGAPMAAAMGRLILHLAGLPAAPGSSQLVGAT